MTDQEEGRWLSYEELSDALGCTPSAACMHAVRRNWPRRSPNRVGDCARVLVPEEALVQARATNERRTFDAQAQRHTTRPFDEPNGHDSPNGAPHDANVVFVAQALDELRDQLGVANRHRDEERARADRAERRADRAEQLFVEERSRADRMVAEKGGAIAGLEVENEGLQRQVDVALAAERGAHYRADQAERRVGELTTELDKRRRWSRLRGAIVALLTLAIAAGGLFYERHTDYFVSADYAAQNRPQLGIHDILLPQDVSDGLTATILNFGNKDAETVALEFAAVDLQTGEVTELGEANWPGLPASQSEQMSLTIPGLDTNNRTKFLRTCLVYTKAGKGGDTTYGEPIYLWLSQLQRGQNYSSPNPPTRTDADRLQTDFPCPRP
jgi:hypothetical protein